MGYMYILECADGSYYTGSTNNLELRLAQHHAGEGANHTKKRLPVQLIYFEEFQRIDEAFNREKQVQGWSRSKKVALIKGCPDLLPELALAYRDLRSGGGACPGGFESLSHREDINAQEDLKDRESEALEGNPINTNTYEGNPNKTNTIGAPHA